MKKNLLAIYFIVSFLLNAPLLFASHIIGGEMSYVCLGNNQYQITLKVFRDCYNGQAGYDDPTYITIYDGNSVLVGSPIPVNFPGSDTLDNNPGNSCLLVPPGICVEEADFIATITLPAIQGGYTMVYQRCCRNMIIVNVASPDSHGTSYVATIPDSTYAQCNSSPYFNNFPPPVICVDQPFSFDHSATDPDGDSLVYQLCSPYDGGEFGNVYPVPAEPPPYVYLPFDYMYSASYPIDANPAMTIDPATGILNLTPTAIGNYVVAICVEEYRNGNFLGEHKRDFQFNVAQCNVLLSVDFDAPDGFANQPIQFTDQSTTNSGYINSWSWDFGDGDTSTDQNPTHTYTSSGSYVVALIVTTSDSCVGQHLQVVHVEYAVGISSPVISFTDEPARLYNIYGEQLLSDMLYEMKNGWITNDKALLPGIYFVAYQTSCGTAVKKIVVQH